MLYLCPAEEQEQATATGDLHLWRSHGPAFWRGRLLCYPGNRRPREIPGGHEHCHQDHEGRQRTAAGARHLPRHQRETSHGESHITVWQIM